MFHMENVHCAGDIKAGIVVLKIQLFKQSKYQHKCYKFIYGIDFELMEIR